MTTTTHTHTAATTRNLPFGGVTLSQCACGARKSSDGKAISGGLLDADGWYVTTPRNEQHEAYARLQNEGYSDGQEAADAEDEFFAGRE